MNKEMTADEVRDKRKAAVTWANLVTPAARSKASGSTCCSTRTTSTRARSPGLH